MFLVHGNMIASMISSFIRVKKHTVCIRNRQYPLENDDTGRNFKLPYFNNKFLEIFYNDYLLHTLMERYFQFKLSQGQDIPLLFIFKSFPSSGIIINIFLARFASRRLIVFCIWICILRSNGNIKHAFSVFHIIPAYQGKKEVIWI